MDRTCRAILTAADRLEEERWQNDFAVNAAVALLRRSPDAILDSDGSYDDYLVRRFCEQLGETVPAGDGRRFWDMQKYFNSQRSDLPPPAYIRELVMAGNLVVLRALYEWHGEWLVRSLSRDRPRCSCRCRFWRRE